MIKKQIDIQRIYVVLMKKTNIALIGFMGTGKTAIGARLAKGLNKEFIEMDDLIVKRAGKSISKIFAEDGEIRFREYEIEICKQSSQKTNVVIACGGGVVLNRINIEYLKQGAVIVCLKSTPEVIFRRISKNGERKRPLLDKPNPMEEIHKLLEVRAPFYDAATEYQIDTSNLTIYEAVNKIIEIYDSVES